MKKNQIYSIFKFSFLIFAVYLLSSAKIESSVLETKPPVISFIKVPNSVEVGSPFQVRIGIISEIQIKFLEIRFDGVSKKLLPKRVDSTVYVFNLTAVTPGRKILEISAVDIKNISGKPARESLNVFKKDLTMGDTKPMDTSAISTPVLRTNPPELRINMYNYCCGDIVVLNGKFFTDDVRVKIGNRKVKVLRVKKNSLKIKFGNFSENSFLYVKNKIGEAKSRYPVRVACIPKIFSFSPAEIGQKEILGINGENLENIIKVKLFIKHLGIDETYNLNIMGGKHKSVLSVKMPDTLNYPGSAFLELNSLCGSSNDVEITIKEKGVDYLKPHIISFSPETAAPGSSVLVYASDFSVPEKKKIKISFNNIMGIIEELEFLKKKGYKLKVSIPEDIDNIVDYNQKVRISSFKNVTSAKKDFFLFGRPVINSIKKTDWSEKYIKITGKNFKEKGTDVYFTGINGKWEKSKEVFYMGFNKIQAKIPRRIKKGHIKVKTLVNGITQFCISKSYYKPEEKK